jgi:hypothetical protein|tara:strand:+ start:116 stop:574 length:459 start_codon:yes stop_codon:yes gene_type:complete
MRIAGILLIVMAVMTGIGYWYYTDTQKRMAILTENNAKLEMAAAISEETLASVRADYAKANGILQDTLTAFRTVEAQNKVLADKLARHDLGLLGASKPGLVVKIINSASDKTGRCFELESGAELTEEEKNAQTANSFNSECPWMWAGNTPAE